MTTEADKPKLPRTPRPLLLTMGEALTFAAENLERLAMDVELGGILLEAISKSDKPLEGESVELFARLREEMREPDLQSKAMKSAAKAIRELALEERLVGVRVAASRINA